MGSWNAVVDELIYAHQVGQIYKLSGGHKRVIVVAFIKACKEQIDILKDSINNEEANTKGWLGIKADASNADTIAHKHGVV